MELLEQRHVEEILGGPRILGKPVKSVLELNDAVERGLPKVTLRNVARRVFSDTAEQRALMHRVVPEATYKRRRDLLEQKGVTIDAKAGTAQTKNAKVVDVSAGARPAWSRRGDDE